jgi:hypothetical protein
MVFSFYLSQPGEAALHTARKLALAAMGKGHGVNILIKGDGDSFCLSKKDASLLSGLVENGAKVFFEGETQGTPESFKSVSINRVLEIMDGSDIWLNI